MGSLRFALALSVIAAHAEFSFGVGGKNAVELFFVISGYLISFILNEDKRYASLGAFYLNRALRIYPLYLVVLVASFALHFVSSHLMQGSVRNVFEESGLGGRALLSFSNLFIFFQDFTFFLDEKSGNFLFYRDSSTSVTPLHEGLLVPPAWSLALELTFYVLAPLLIRRRIVLVTLLVATIGIKAFISGQGLGGVDPWNYRFFPAELSFFLLGSTTHIFWKPLISKWSGCLANGLHLKASSGVAVGVIVFFPLVEFDEELKSILLVFVTTLLLPFLFSRHNSSRLEKHLAELSYPMYLWHILILSVVGSAASLTELHLDAMTKFLCTVLLTLAVSLLSNMVLGRRVEVLRAHFRDRTSKSESVV